jgi:tetratricopeptide (TPR) repeat protein
VKSGDVIAGRFELGEVAGAGGMGRVHRALDRESGAAVAVKVLAAGAAQHRERFAWEARLLEQLRHPAIVRHVAHGITDDGELFLAMEWLEGEDLAQRLARGPLSVPEMLALARRLLGGLAAAHALGVIHRDVKPSNVHLEGGDPARARLLDFGIARLRGAVLTKTGHVLGTIGYMAPEQARAERDLDARADVFSAGCVLFECLAGRPAFHGEHPVAVLTKILYEEPPRLGAIRGDVPAALDELIARAMAKRAADRPAGAAELDRALAAIDGAGVHRGAPPTSGAPPTLTDSEQRRLYVIVAARPTSPETLEHGATQALSEAEDLRRRLQADAARFGAELEVLTDGSAVATLTGARTATDHAAAAARYALALRRALPAVPIAVATGTGFLAGGLPVGEVVDRAAALLRDAGSAIRTDDAMAGLLDGRFDLEGGAAGFELRGEREPALLTRTLLGRPSPVVGRDRELAVLEACYRECAADELARVVLVTAPPGGGKSRLLRELLGRLARAGASPEIWIARGDPMSAGSPFGMLAQVVRRAAGIVDGEPAAVRARKLRDRVWRHVPAVRAGRVTARLAELAGVPDAQAEDPELRAARQDAMGLGEQLRRAFADFVAAECAAGPVIVVLEDLHWGDAATVKAIDEVLRELRERRLLVIALARPEVHELFPRLWAGRAVTNLELGPLPRRASERLVRAMLGDAVSQAVIDKVVALAAGNAFYLEELIRAVAVGRIEELPDTVLAMVDARLEALDPEHRRVLRAASVFGEVFWQAGLAELLGAAAPARLAASLAELLEQEVIERRLSPRFPEHDEYGFRHGLVREAAYRRLTDADRALGHRLAGDWLERAGEIDASVLAEHFDRGGAPARAVRWYVRAGQDAIAGASFERGIAVAERGVACGAAGRDLGRLRLVQTDAHAMRFELAECARAGTEALALLERGTGEWFGAAGAVAMACGLRGERDRAAALVAEIIDTEPEPDALTSCLAGCCLTMMVLSYSGLYLAAAGLLARMEGLQVRLAPDDRAALAFVAQARWWAACTDDDPWQRLVLARRSAALRDEVGYSGFGARVHADLGVSLHGLGAYAEAERVYVQALEIADRTGTVQGTTFLELFLGATLLDRGRLHEAEALFSRVQEACRRTGERYFAGCADVQRARLLARRGDAEGAEQAARRAIDYPHVRPLRAHANAVLASALLVQGRADEALAAARQGKRLFDALGGVHEGDALIHLALASALAAAGPADEAARALGAARDRLLARAAKIEDATLRETFLRDVAVHARTLAAVDRA